MDSSIAATLLLKLLLGSVLPTASADRNGISARDIYEEMEHILVDNKGTNSDGLVNAITPCSNYINGDDTDGEQSSAQWVRIAFHDIATADVAAGTGGLDASVGFESNRPENPGLFINQTIGFFNPDVSAYVSMADMLALGVVASVATCGGTTTDIPLRTGRVDASAAGPSGVPEPGTDIDTTLSSFAAAGFDQSEAIALTACGHSLGRTHYTNFPDIVDESYVTTDNTDGGQEFDSTPAVFDSAVVTEYLDQTGEKGGPLVTTTNETQRSDFRLYNSDQNATIESLAASEDSFQTQCNTLFAKMIDTVPSDVVLSDPITPMPWKATDIGLDISSSGSVSVAGLIRNLYGASESAASSVSYTYTANGTNSSAVETTGSAGSGSSLYGTTAWYNFNTTIESPGTTALNINSAISYPINVDIFVLPAKSSTNTRSGTVTLYAAALSNIATDSDTMTATFYVATSQTGSRANTVTTKTVTLTESGAAGAYTLYTASATGLSSIGDVIVKVSMGDYASQTVKTSIFG
ncbi:Uu.00g078870.m01.CDS01 [Anthostomella pinea]|uniref:Peroxidase n=1 Tax=Anthostomella pinea TaxID=933095 RepID=A0AAI8VLN0_9PEZI|nr:Uu.00g078870.m01.CDS01 [Anthostomella pinea]